ncbi:LOW QUALITY PROTEIN: zona pellucida sperm-binding protein 2-like [Pelodytes ibericus]
MEIKVFSKLIVLVLAFASEVNGLQSSTSGFILSKCKRSLVQINLAELVLDQHVTFSAIDQFGRAFVIDNYLATQCGYTVSYDDWGEITLRASLLSCYTKIGNDSTFTVTIKVDVSPNANMKGAVTYLKVVQCPYVWDAREIVCENYMEVSVRRKIPLIAEGAFQDEPEDWSTAFPEAVSGLMSVWQVVFHLTSTRKAMLVTDAQNYGYGINTTESRILLRAPYNASEAQLQRVNGVGFSTVRATIFYKQRWLILLVDTAVACPVDDVKHTAGKITWTVPKSISPLLIGASTIKSSSIQVGVDLTTLTPNDLLTRNYLVVDDSKATVVTVPWGADGGYYKSRVANGNYGIIYNIRLFLENRWEDNRWGVTKYTVIREITTPFALQPPTITNQTVAFTKIFNVTIGTFLPDVKLVNITIGAETLTVAEATALGYNISSLTLPNGNLTYILKVPFSDSNVKTEYIPDYTRRYTLNVTFGFLIIPSKETFTVSAVITALITDAVPPVINGNCTGNFLNLNVIRGNVDTQWVPYIKNVPVTSETAQSNGFVYTANKTHYTVSIPPSSKLVSFDEVSSSGLKITLPLTLKDAVTGLDKYQLTISCSYPTTDLIACFPNGTMTVVVMKLTAIPDMDLSTLQLKDRSCKPSIVTETSAKFIFPVSTCGTTRKFTGNSMTYENAISYYRPGATVPAYTLQVSCKYTINHTVIVQYGFVDNPTPSTQTAMASLTLVLRLSKDKTYTMFYGDGEYPVVRYLRDPLYFEVELLYSIDPQLELFLENCWATASPDLNGFPSWPVVVNSCDYPEAYNTTFHPVTADSRVKFPSHLKRFDVKMFTFMQEDLAYLGQIYFHCSAIICKVGMMSSDPLCTGACIPQRQRMGRSVDSGSDKRIHASSGPLLLQSVAGLNNM